MAWTDSTMWEAFVGGTGWGDSSPGALTSADVASDEAYAARVEDFYNKIVGPSFGYEQGGVGFGTAFQSSQGQALFGIGDERSVLDLAEREFRVSIGDPYAEASDPFSWENISRYGIDEYSVSEAQKMMEDKLHGKGFLLGGETGSEYGLSMERQGEAYTSGLTGQREGLTYEGLTGVAGLASGTSGSVLRSGESTLQAEDVLARAYEESKGLGTAYIEGKEKTELELETDLKDALDTYMGIINDQKQEFLGNVLYDIQIWKRVSGADDPETFEEESLFGDPDVMAGFVEGDWGTLEYGDLADYDFREDGVCGVGEIYSTDPEDPDSGLACRAIKGLKPNIYGELVGTGTGFDETLYDCHGVYEGTAVIDCAGICGGDAVLDECDVCNGDGSTCADECGMPNGSGPNVACSDGSIVCDESECPTEIGEEGDQCDSQGDCAPCYRCDAGGCLYTGLLDPRCEGSDYEKPEDCAGTPDGSAVEDECGVCGGDNTTCADCAGTPWGDAKEDCEGVCGGSAVLDECDVCNGDGSSCYDYGCGPGVAYITCPDTVTAVCDIADCSDPVDLPYDEGEEEEESEFAACPCVRDVADKVVGSSAYYRYVCDNTDNPLHGRQCIPGGGQGGM